MKNLTKQPNALTRHPGSASPANEPGATLRRRCVRQRVVLQDGSMESCSGPTSNVTVVDPAGSRCTRLNPRNAITGCTMLLHSHPDVKRPPLSFDREEQSLLCPGQLIDRPERRNFWNGSYLDYYHRSRTHLSCGKDSPEPRGIQPPEMGSVVATGRRTAPPLRTTGRLRRCPP